MQQYTKIDEKMDKMYDIIVSTSIKHFPLVVNNSIMHIGNVRKSEPFV